MRRGFIIAAAVLVIFLGTAWAEPVKLKLATIEPAQGIVISRVLTPWIGRVNADAEGSLNIKAFPGGTLGRNPLAQLKLLNDGVADIAWILNSYSPGRFPDDMVVTVPFTAGNCLEASLAIHRMHERGLLRGYHDLVVMGLLVLPVYNIHTNFPVTSPQELKGKKIRAAGRMQFSLIEAYGGTPVAIPITKAAESISRGVIQGTISEWNGMVVFRILDIARHHCLVPLGSVTVMLAMNKRSYDMLPANARAAIDKHKGEPLIRSFGRIMDEKDIKIFEDTKNNPKHEVIIPSADQMAQWKALNEPVIESWKKDNPKGEMLLKTYTEEIARVRAER